MPVISVTASALESAEDEVRALAGVAVEVADALGLAPEDVQVSCVHSTVGVLGRHAVAPWPLVVFHGRPRGPEHMAEALRRAREVVASAWQRSADEVWLEWSAPLL